MLEKLFNFPEHSKSEIVYLYKQGTTYNKLVMDLLYDRTFLENRGVKYWEADKHIFIAQDYVRDALEEVGIALDIDLPRLN